MSVQQQLGLAEGGDLLARVRDGWVRWATQQPCLGVVSGVEEFSAWSWGADREVVNEALVALAELASPAGGDDEVAAAALAYVLLPGVRRVAAGLAPRLHAQGWGPGEVDALAAAQLWVEVRQVRWWSRPRVAAGVVQRTRRGLLIEAGSRWRVPVSERAWANTTLVDPASAVWADQQVEEPGGADELVAVLAWATEAGVISREDRRLLVYLMEEAHRQEQERPQPRMGRGFGGLLGTELSRRVGERVGLSQATVRRRARRSMRALAAAAPGYAAA